ncbi:MAG: ThiF family adenylyltransferase [Eubacteriales bacterium]
MIKNKNDDFHIYITQDTLRGIMLEKARHPGLECIIQMPGRRIGNKFYYNMVADSGINGTYKYAMCEKDHKYCDHLSSMIASYYDFPYEELVVSQIHFHPAQYKHFSQGDNPSNAKLAEQFGGVTNGLMWIDPEFHIQFWYIDQEGNETPVKYTIDDEMVAEALPLRSLDNLKKYIEDNEMGIILRHSINATSISAHKRENTNMGNRKDKTVISKISNFCKQALGEEKNKMKYQCDKKNESIMENDFKRNTSEEGTSEIIEDNAYFESACELLRPYKILLPEEYRTIKYIGCLFGYYISETKTFHVVTDNLIQSRNDTTLIGKSYQRQEEFNTDMKEAPYMQLVWTEEGAVINVSGSEDANVIIEYYSLQKELFSRNTGILEASQMLDKQAIIPGLGSGGFFLGLELVKAGIGSLIVADDDVFAYHNICRHVCGIHDVGHFKVDLFKERAADINPNCLIYTFRDLIQQVDPKVLEEIVWKKSIILCCTDNRHAGYICNALSDKFHIPMVDGGCGVRASTGEIFYYKPDSGMACYTCAYGEDIGRDHSNQSVRRKFYATESELEKLHFQPGMSLDIGLTSIFQTKLAIDLLMEDEEGYVPKLLPYINQCTILLNYPVDQEVNPYMQLFNRNGKTLRPMIWKSGCAEKNIECSYCNQ